MQANGLATNTVRSTKYILKRLNRETDLMNPEAVKLYVGKLTLCNPTKQKMIECYEYFVETNQLQWTKPRYRWDTKTPMIPLKHQVEAIIAAASFKCATIFTILAETGLEGAELHNVTEKDIDSEQGIITAAGNKGHSGRSFRLKRHTAEMLRIYLEKYRTNRRFNQQKTAGRPFPKPQIMSQAWRDARKRAATKLNNPELDKILLKSLRNYSGAQLYYLTSDPWRVMLHLGHKKLETTQHYISGMKPMNDDQEWTCKTAANAKEASELIEQGFTFVERIESEGLSLYRKRK
jgi:integrase